MQWFARVPWVVALGIGLALMLILMTTVYDDRVAIGVALGWLVIYFALRLGAASAEHARLRAAAAELGLTLHGWFGYRIDGALPEIGRVYAVVAAADADTGRRVLHVRAGTELPRLSSAVAHALVGEAGAAWTYEDGSWRLRTDLHDALDAEAAEHALSHLRTGIALSRIVLVSKRMSVELQALLGRPEGLKECIGSAPGRELRDLVRSEIPPEAAIRLASLLRDPALLRELADKEGDAPGEAFSALVRVAPTSPEASALVDAWIARRDSLSVAGLRRIALGLRSLRHPLGDEVLSALLTHPDHDLRMTAMHSLHEVGTPAAIPALAPIAAARNGDLALVAADAIAVIKKRARGAPSGGLALVESGSVGALALPSGSDDG